MYVFKAFIAIVGIVTHVYTPSMQTLQDVQGTKQLKDAFIEV